MLLIWCIFLFIWAQVFFIYILRLTTTSFILSEILPLSYFLRQNIISHQQIITPPSSFLEKACFRKIVLTFKVWNIPYVISEILKNQHIASQLCKFDEYRPVLNHWATSQTIVAPARSRLFFCCCIGISFCYWAVQNIGSTWSALFWYIYALKMTEKPYLPFQEAQKLVKHKLPDIYRKHSLQYWFLKHTMNFSSP